VNARRARAAAFVGAAAAVAAVAVLLRDDRTREVAPPESSPPREAAVNAAPTLHGPTTDEDMGPHGQARARARTPRERLSVRVLDPDGKPATGAEVLVKDPSRRGPDIAITATTDETGTARFDPFDSGISNVEVRARRGHWLSYSSSTGPGQTDLEVRLRGARSVDVTVLDGEGLPLGGARVGAQGSTPPAGLVLYRPGRADRVWTYASALTDATGIATLEIPVEEAPNRLSVAAGRDDVLPRSDAWDGRPTTVRLERAYRVAGVVVDSTGAPPRGFRMQYRVGDAWVDARPSVDGTFLVRGLRAGPVTLRAALEGAPLDDDAATVMVPAGTEDVRLRVDTSAEIVVRFESWTPAFRVKAYLTPETAGRSESEPIEVDVSLEGVARFRGVRRDTAYTLWSPLDDDDRIAYRRGVTAADSPLAVPREKGRSIRVRVASDGRHGPVHVAAYGPGIPGVPAKDGVIDGLPEGTWHVRAWADDPSDGDAGPVRGEASAEAGGEVEVVLGSDRGKR
jgi:hypothetical protein